MSSRPVNTYTANVLTKNGRKRKRIKVKAEDQESAKRIILAWMPNSEIESLEIECSTSSELIAVGG